MTSNTLAIRNTLIHYQDTFFQHIHFFHPRMSGCDYLKHLLLFVSWVKEDTPHLLMPVCPHTG